MIDYVELFTRLRHKGFSIGITPVVTRAFDGRIMSTYSVSATNDNNTEIKTGFHRSLDDSCRELFKILGEDYVEGV